MKIRKNRIRQSFREQRVTFGLWHGMADTYAAEICAGAGFDWIVIDAEHGPFEITQVLRHHQAMAAHDVGIAVRPPIGDPVYIKRLLDMGVQTFVVPMVETAGQAAELVRAMRYPPVGKRGVGATLSRAAQWGRVGEYFQKAEEELCLIVQVESAIALSNLETICAVDGVDGVFIGPADLGASLGYPGQSNVPEVREKIHRALRTIRAAGKAPGILALTEEAVKSAMEAGALFIGTGADLLLFEEATRKLASTVRGL